MATGWERRGGGYEENTASGGAGGGDEDSDRGEGEDDEGGNDRRWSWCVPGWFTGQVHQESFAAALRLMISSTD